MATNFKFNNGGNTADFTDVFVPRAAFSQGGLWSVGSNNYGQFGNNTQAGAVSPVQTISGGADWKTLSMGRRFLAAIKTDGTLWMWGTNGTGQLGDNTQVPKSSPVQTISGGTNWKQVSCNRAATGGYASTAAIKTDGSLWLWGSNNFGQLGDNTIGNKSSPIQTIAGGFDWKQVSFGYTHVVTIKTDGTLWAWGQNSGGTNGSLGDNSTVDKSSPVQVIGGGNTWKQVAAGSTHTAAIKTDGTLWTWGVNSNGSLGDNTNTIRSSPVQTIAAGTNWKQVSTGNNTTAAVKTDGTLWLWGNNATYGMLGDNTVADKSSPVQTIAGGTNWKQVVSSPYVTGAIKTNGTVWAWGGNNYQNLGISGGGQFSSPVMLFSGTTNWKEFQPHMTNSAAITDIF